MLTFLPLQDIIDIENQMNASSYKPNTAQKILAKEVTEFIHGKEGLKIAQNVTNAAKPGSDSTLDYETLKQISKDMPNINVTFSDIIGKKYTEVACQIGLTSSKSEALRLVKNNGAYLNNKKVIDPSIIISEKDLINDTFLLFGAGKKKRILVTIEKK